MFQGEIIREVLLLLTLFVVGFLLRKVSILDASGIAALKKVIVNLSLPALLFDAFFRLEADAKTLLLASAVFAVCILTIGIGVALCRILRLEGVYAPLLYEGFEAGMLGYALFYGLAGDANLPFFAACDLGQVVFVFLILRFQLLRRSVPSQEGGRGAVRTILIDSLRSPVIAAIILGLVLGGLLRNLGVYSSVNESTAASALWRLINLVKALATPLVCLVIGADIHIDRRNALFAVKLSLSRIAIMALLALALGDFFVERVLGLPSIYRFALLVLFLLPPPFVIPVFMKDEESVESRRVATTLSVHSLVSILAVSLVSFLAFPR